jgi:hypothetical protein
MWIIQNQKVALWNKILIHCCILLDFFVNYTMMHGSTNIKLLWCFLLCHSHHLPACLPACVSLSVCLSVCLTTYRSIDPSIHPPINASVNKYTKPIVFNLTCFSSFLPVFAWHTEVSYECQDSHLNWRRNIDWLFYCDVTYAVVC